MRRGSTRLQDSFQGLIFSACSSAPGYVPELHNNIPCIAADCPSDRRHSVVLGVGTAATINFALDPGGVISGTVRRASNGSGIQGLTVYVYKATKTLVTSAVTGPGGTYSVGGLPTGSYFRRGRRADRRRHQHRITCSKRMAGSCAHRSSVR